jgi:superkiller protein 3
MYVPMVGLAVMLAWGVADFVRSRPRARAWIAPLACGACLAMAVTTWAQTGYWRNAELLFRHTLAVTGENELAYTWLAAQLDHNPATWPEALADLQAAARLNPASSMGHANLANMYEVMGRSPEAISQYEQALLADSGNAAAHDGLGKILAKQGRLPEALAHFRTVQRLDPGNPQGRIDTAAALLAAGQSAEGIRVLQEGLTKYPGEPRIYNMLGYALIGIPGRVDEGVERLERAVALSPDFADAHNNLGIAMFRTGRIDLAVEHFEAAIRLDPGFAGAHRNLGVALLRVPGRQGEGVDHLRVAQRLAPDPALRRMLEGLGVAQ